MAEHGLTQRQLVTIGEVLRPFREQISHAGLFGSRAAGTARRESDVDLVLYGLHDQAIVDRIRTLFDLSDLALHVDVIAYELIDYAPLRLHIDQVAVPLPSP